VQLYSASTTQFLEDIAASTLAGRLQQRFFDEYRFAPSDGEVRAWTNSLHEMATVVRDAELLDHGVLVEYQLPLTSRRLDCMFTGHAGGSAAAVIVELKQWDYVLPSWVDECVSTTVGMRERDVLHPSAQVGGYRRYLLDTNTAFAEAHISLDSASSVGTGGRPSASGPRRLRRKSSCVRRVRASSSSTTCRWSVLQR
jgi:uncharacterized protein